MSRIIRVPQNEAPPSANSFFQAIAQYLFGISLPVKAKPEAAENDVEGIVVCTCGWTGKGTESVRKYHVLGDDAVEMEIFCKRCRNYLGFRLFKKAA